MKSFIKVTDFTTEELEDLFNRADHLYQCWHQNQMPQSLAKQRIALWFYGKGFRNRMAFEIGARAMGADVSYVPGDLGVQEPIDDIGYYLKNWFTMLIIRAAHHEDLLKVVEQTKLPVINGRTDFNHPCEIIGDLQYIRQKRKSLDGLFVAFVGEVTNLCMSWFEAAVRLPIQVTQIAPSGYQLSKDVLNKMNDRAVGNIQVTDSLDEGIHRNTDVIYTDCWPKNIEKEKAKAIFMPYQITTNILERVHKQSFFLPCPPVTRGEEVSEEAMKSPLCVDYEAKEFLLHAQNAIMEYLVS